MIKCQDFYFSFQKKGTDLGGALITLEANSLDEAVKEIDKYVEENLYDYYVNNYKDGKYIIDLYEYEIKNSWTIEEDND